MKEEKLIAEIQRLTNQIQQYGDICKYLIAASFILLDTNCSQEGKITAKTFIEQAKSKLESMD